MSGARQVDIGGGTPSQFSQSSISSSSSRLGLSASLPVEALDTVDNFAQLCLNLLVVGPCPPSIHSHDEVFPFSPLFHFQALLSTQTEKQKQDRPGNEAILNACSWFQHLFILSLVDYVVVEWCGHIRPSG